MATAKAKKATTKRLRDAFIYLSGDDAEPQDHDTLEDALNEAEINGEHAVYVYRLVGQFHLKKDWQQTA